MSGYNLEFNRILGAAIAVKRAEKELEKARERLCEVSIPLIARYPFVCQICGSPWERDVHELIGELQCPVCGGPLLINEFYKESVDEEREEK